MVNHGETLSPELRNGHSLPQSLEEAEAILTRMAYPFVKDSPDLVTGAVRVFAPKAPPIKKSPGVDLHKAVASIQPFRAAYEAIPDALLIVVRDGTVVHVNSQMVRLFGYSSEEIVGQPVELFVPERFREWHPHRRQAYFDEPHVRPMGANLELHGRHRDGHEFPVEISLSPLETAVGMMVVATLRDLSQQRKIQERIRRFEARYRTLVEGLPAVTFMAALDGEVNELYVSPQIESLLGFSQEEWLGNPILWYTQLHPDDRMRWHTEFAVTCSTGTKFNSIYRFYSRSGRVVWVHGEAKVVRDDQGRPLFLQGVAFDITQLKEAEEQLRQLNQTLESRVRDRTAELSAANDSLQSEIRERQRAEAEVRRMNQDLAEAHQQAIEANQTKSHFLANMSHELRTPLNAIIGYSELLQLLATKKKDTSLNADLEKINKSGKHLLILINDILDISKIEAGKLQLELNVFGVEPLVTDIRETVMPLAARNNNQFQVTCDQNLWQVRADAVRLKQCLLNLLSNACKFTQQGEVLFRVFNVSEAGKDWLCFEVRDTGIGLSSDQANRLFQPFTQADASTTRKFGGTGLGLAITKKLCEAMDGNIILRSDLGAGSTFTIRLPRHA